MKYYVLKPFDDTFLESQNETSLSNWCNFRTNSGSFLQQPPKAASVDLYKSNHIYDMIYVSSNHRDL